ncbi:S26 family signal peptidase [Rhizocola hellebori]|nr:S26 family signal peptidase [Rhizocola hellebori]
MIYVAVAVGALVVLAVARLVWRYTIAIVDGSSMEPTLWAGDRLLVRRCPLTKLRRGDIVVVRESPSPDVSVQQGPSLYRLLVKRAVAVAGDPLPPVLREGEGVVPQGAILILGDNPYERRDSRRYGYVRDEQVVGRAVRRLGE